MKVNIFGIDIDNYSFNEVNDIIISHVIGNKEPQYVVTPNASHLVRLQNDSDFQEIYRNAFLSVPDGVPLLWVAKLQKTPLKTRVNGTDLLESLCAISAKEKLKVFFLGGRPGAANKAAFNLRQKYPDLIVETYCPPYGFEHDTAELTKINQVIQTTAPDLLFVGLGAPKQERWMAENYQQLNVPMSLGIGVSFEFVGGVIKRAPLWMQKAGLEWLSRLIREPRRLFKRTIVVNSVFIWLVCRQQFRQVVFGKVTV